MRARSSCTPAPAVQRSKYVGEVADLCFSDCDAFFAAEQDEAAKLNCEDPIEDASILLLCRQPKRIECKGGRSGQAKCIGVVANPKLCLGRDQLVPRCVFHSAPP